MKTLIRPALSLFVLMSVITGLAYPVAVTGIAGTLFPKEAAGSLIVKDGTIVGSALVGDSLLLGTAGQSWVSTVDLQTLSPESMLLDAPIVSFHYLPGPGRIVVTHSDSVGHLTVVDPQDPSRKTSRVHWGYLLQHVLD